MTGWARTEDGWAVNLDGSDAASDFRLPRLELHAGPHGWTCECHLEGGTVRTLSLGAAATAAQARRAAVESALAALGASYEAALRRLL